MKRFWMILFVLLGMVACGSDEPAMDEGTTVDETVVEPVEESEPLELTVSFPGDRRKEAMESLIGEFVAMKLGEGVEVDVSLNQPTDGYYDQVLLDFSAGVGPDVFSVGADGIPEFVSSEYIMPLDDMLNGWDEWASFPDGMKAMTQYQGQTYGVMYETDTRVLYYRTDVFEQVGLPVPWTPTSWDDIFAAAATIRDSTEGIIPMEIESGTIWGEGTTTDGFFMLFKGADGMLYDPADDKWIIESPAILDSFQFYDDVFANNLSDATLFMEPEPWVAYLQEGFANGTVGIVVGFSGIWDLYNPTDGAWLVPNRDEVMAWTPMPSKTAGAGVEGRDFVGVGGGWGWAVASDTEIPELAQEFVQFMTSASSVSTYVNEMGTIPSRSDAVSTDPFLVALAEEVLPYQSFTPSHPDYGKVSAEIQLATERIMLDQTDAQGAMEQFAAAVEAQLGADSVKRVVSE